MKNDNTNLLVPLQVPWSLSASGSLLKLRVVEEQDAFLEATVLDLGTKNIGDNFNCCRIELKFNYFASCRVDPIYTGKKDDYIFSQYNWRRVMTPHFEPVSNVDKYATTKKIWLQSGICPNPKAYYVENSSWLATCPPDCASLKHFFFVGTEVTIGIIAKSYSYKYVI